MKYFYILIISIISISCRSDKSKEKKDKINFSLVKVEAFDIRAEQIYDQNSVLNQQLGLPEKENASLLFKQFDDSLQVMRDELISTAGGFTKEGLYFNAPAYNYVSDYFYGKTNFRSNSHQFFFNNLDRLINNLKQLAPNNKLPENIEGKFLMLKEHYGLNKRNDLFKDLSINEAVELIEGFRRKVAHAQYEYIVNKNNKIQLPLTKPKPH